MHRHSRFLACAGFLRRSRLLLPALIAAGALSLARPAAAQELVGSVQPDTVVSEPEGGVTPKGAFLRAVLLPGWGHASIESHHRGAFYVVTEGATAWTLLKTRRRYDEVGERILFHEGIVRSTLEAEGVTDLEEIQKRLDADPTLEDLRNLQEARRQQREDWTAVGIFLVFLAGVDAFVSAHLKDFPAPLELNAVPVGDGRFEFSVGITLPR